MQCVEKGLTGQRGVGKIARIAQIRGQVIAAPKTRGVVGERIGPALDKVLGVGFVAEFAAR